MAYFVTHFTGHPYFLVWILFTLNFRSFFLFFKINNKGHVKTLYKNIHMHIKNASWFNEVCSLLFCFVF